MTEDGLFVCKSVAMSDRRGGDVTEREEEAGGLEVLLREPEIVAWLEDYRPQPDEAPDDEPPRAA
jgi:hypothetical protein